MTAAPDGLVDGKAANDLESAKFTKDKDQVDVVQPTAKLIGLTKEQLEQYRNDPFWKAIRYSLFVAFWLVWLAMFVGAILIVVLSPKCPEVKWTQKMVNYKIFTLAYKDSESTDGLGDFAGIKEKLNDVKDLGVSVIWPTPVLTFNKNELSPEAIVSLDVSEQLGGEEKFKELVKQAHAKDLKIVVDLPLTVDASSDNWAKKLEGGGATSGTKNGIASLNVDNAQVKSKLIETAKRFLEYGVDGLHITNYGMFNNSATEAIIKEVRALSGAEHIPIFSETNLKGDENYYRISPLVGSEQSKNKDGFDVLKTELENNLADVGKELEQNGTVVKQVWSLGSLDPNGNRVDQLLGDKSKSLDNDQKQRISALFTAVQLFIPGPVSVLYGEELGLLSGKPSKNKKINRISYPWTNETLDKQPQTFFALPEKTQNGDFASQKQNPNSPLSLFKAIAKLRQSPDFVLGKFAHSSVGDISYFLVKRFPSGEGFYLLVLNWGTNEAKLDNDVLMGLAKANKPFGNAEVRASTESKIAGGKRDLGHNEIRLGPYGAVLLDVPK